MSFANEIVSSGSGGITTGSTVNLYWQDTTNKEVTAKIIIIRNILFIIYKLSILTIKFTYLVSRDITGIDDIYIHQKCFFHCLSLININDNKSRKTRL